MLPLINLYQWWKLHTYFVQHQLVYFGFLLVNMQDDYAVQSFERGIAAQEAGAFTWEIVPVSILLYRFG